MYIVLGGMFKLTFKNHSYCFMVLYKVAVAICRSSCHCECVCKLDGQGASYSHAPMLAMGLHDVLSEFFTNFDTLFKLFYLCSRSCVLGCCFEIICKLLTVAVFSSSMHAQLNHCSV